MNTPKDDYCAKHYTLFARDYCSICGRGMCSTCINEYRDKGCSACKGKTKLKPLSSSSSQSKPIQVETSETQKTAS